MLTYETGVLTDVPAANSSADAALLGTAKQLAADIESALVRGDIFALPPEALQALMSALCRTYTAQSEMGSVELPLPGGTLANATDVMTTASGLLRGANVAAFEFAMWQSWGGH